MNLDEIQPNLLSILRAIPLLEDVQDHILIDDGTKDNVMEESLRGEGLSILIMPPQGVGMTDAGLGVVEMEYVTTIWVRTNPKVQSSVAEWITLMWSKLLEVLGILNPEPMAMWNPLILEADIIKATLAFGGPPTNFFQITEGSEPETDFTDVGNNSRLIRFSTNVIMQ